MQAGIHPNYETINVTCACGNEFQTRSTMSDDFRTDICSACHPFFTGTQKIVDSTGRVERFNNKFAKFDLTKIKRR
ncbi:MAG: 50S ribosomal protein L31 [Deltaproteobacteria bacterium]|nr:50S ribosomal protein L31 [Deltaproteobacteria bacterium]